MLFFCPLALSRLDQKAIPLPAERRDVVEECPQMAAIPREPGFWCCDFLSERLVEERVWRAPGGEANVVPKTSDFPPKVPKEYSHVLLPNRSTMPSRTAACEADLSSTAAVLNYAAFFSHLRTTKQVVMPHMVSISDGVVLSLYLAPVSISSEARAGVPGDFAISMDMGSMSRGGYHFGREPVVTIANVLKLRCVGGVPAVLRVCGSCLRDGVGCGGRRMEGDKQSGREGGGEGGKGGEQEKGGSDETETKRGCLASTIV